MRQLVTIILLLTSFEGFGQNDSQSGDKKNFDRIELGINISPDFTDLILRNNDGSWTADWIIDQRNERETPKLGLSAGLTFGYRFTNVVGIETGILYSNKGYQTEKNELTFGDMLDPRYGFSSSNSNSSSAPTHSRFIYSFHYVGIPIKANFRVGNDKWKFISSIGVVTEFLTKSTNTVVLFMSDDSIERNTEASIDEFNLVNLSPTVSVGVEYNLTAKMSLRAEPTVRFGVLQITETPVTGYLYSAGLQIGYYLKL